MVSVKDQDALKALESANEKIAVLENQMLKLQEELDLFKDREALAKLSKDIRGETLDSFENSEQVLSKETLEKMDKQRQAMIELYEKETIDESWAYQTQDAINNALNESGDASAYNVEELKCKSTICKLEVRPYKQNKNAALMAGISASSAIHLGEAFKGFDTELKLNEEEGSHTTTMYLIKHK